MVIIDRLKVDDQVTCITNEFTLTADISRPRGYHR